VEVLAACYDGDLIFLTRQEVNNPNSSLQFERVVREGRCLKKGWLCETFVRYLPAYHSTSLENVAEVSL
jgi:hypothetical protein